MHDCMHGCSLKINHVMSVQLPNKLSYVEICNCSKELTYLRVLDFRIPSGFRHFGLFILERYLWRLVKRTTTQERAARTTRKPFAREGFTRELQSLYNLRVRQIIDSWHPGPSCSKKPCFSRYKMWENLFIARSIAPWFNLWKEQYRFDYEVCGLAEIWPNVWVEGKFGCIRSFR